jgi:DNA-binding NtrC family response regulator
MKHEGAMGLERTEPPTYDASFDGLYRVAAEREGKPALRLREWIACAEAWRIAQVLRECRGNRTEAARRLGIGRRTLYTKMDRLGLVAEWSVRAPGADGATG